MFELANGQQEVYPIVGPIDIRFENRIFGLTIRRLNGQWIVQFADGRADNQKAAAFRKYLLDHHNVEVRSSATTSGRWAA